MRWLTSVGVLFACALTLRSAPLPPAPGGRAADYERTARFKGAVTNSIFRDRLKSVWAPNGTQFLYNVKAARDRRECIAVDIPEGRKSPAFDAKIIAAALAKVATNAAGWAGPDLEALRIDNKGLVGFDWEGRHWQYAPVDQTVTEAVSDKAPPVSPQVPRRERRRHAHPPSGGPGAPNGAFQVILKDFNVWLRAADGTETALTSDGIDGHAYEGPVYWAPDSSRFVVLRVERPKEREIPVVEAAPKDQVQPRLKMIPYAKPGDPIAVQRVHLFDPVAKKEIPITPDLAPTPWDLWDLRWMPDSKWFSFVYNQRGHQVMRVIAIAPDGTARAAIEERSPTFIDHTNKIDVRYLDASQEMIWMSERSGWNHLYLYDAATGAVKNAITSGSWVVKKILAIDEEARRIWFVCAGVRPGEDPYYEHLARANLDGSGFALLTEGNGTHDFDFDPHRPYFLCWWSRPDHPRVHELRETETGKLVCEIERTDWTALLATGWRPPEAFVAKGRDGETDIYGVIYRPSNFDPKRRYPVIEDIYAGPQEFVVSKSSVFWSYSREMAEIGFIVVDIDGMGTNWRSKKFHDVCWKNLGDAGFPDRIAWIKAAAAKYPQMDLTRVGIFGGSAGGQNAMRALIAHPEFYKAAAADCGCHDNRMDKIWWNEQWMGWPIGPEYAAQSNVTQAHLLQGKLLLTYGGMDTNVDPATTPQVVQALVDADKDFELVFVPNGEHGTGAEGYGWRRTKDFFVRALLDHEPRIP